MNYNIKDGIITINIRDICKDKKGKKCCLCRNDITRNKAEDTQQYLKILKFLNINKENVCTRCKQSLDSKFIERYKKDFMGKWSKDILNKIDNWEKEELIKNRFTLIIDNYEVVLYKSMSKQDICTFKYVFRKMKKIDYLSFVNMMDYPSVEDDLFHYMKLFCNEKNIKKDEIARIEDDGHSIEYKILKRAWKARERANSIIIKKAIKDKDFIEFCAVDGLRRILIKVNTALHQS